MNRPALGVFFILWCSYAFFWHARDWNSASRLMLTYAIVDRGTIRIDGLEAQTGDKAVYRNHSYTDKVPGYSLLGVVPYFLAKSALGLPAHPLGAKGFAFWPADYWITLFTSGLLTAITGSILVVLSRDLGCGPRRAATIGLAYGLATPAYAYATLAYGHQAAAACLIGAFALLMRPPNARDRWVVGFAGLLAAYASVVEIQVGPVSAILGFYILTQVIAGRRSPASLIAFALGAAVPTLVLLVYNAVAFDSPFRMGYFFLTTKRFAEVHSKANPLGLASPAWERIDDLLIGAARGLFWYAPSTLLMIPGLVALCVLRRFAVAIVSAATVLAVIVVNLSYPEWTGGWTTGPRLLVPMLPFAMLPVAGLLAIGGRSATWIASILAMLGAVVILLFQGVGARVPDPQPVPPGVIDRLASPLDRAVWPIWCGERTPEWLFGRRFTRSLISIGWPDAVASLPPNRQWMQFVPLVGFQAVTIGLLLAFTRPRQIKLRKSTDSRSLIVESPPPARPDPG